MLKLKVGCCLYGVHRLVILDSTLVLSAFSKLRRILSDQRMLLDVALVEQLMVLCLDAAPWEEYNFQPVLDRLVNSTPRLHFRLARADKGSKRAPRKEKGKGKEKAKGGANFG